MLCLHPPADPGLKLVLPSILPESVQLVSASNALYMQTNGATILSTFIYAQDTSTYVSWHGRCPGYLQLQQGI